MGCHTWFSRPVTKSEFDFFRNNAIEHSWRLNGNTEENIKLNCVDMEQHKKVVNSVKNNTDYWWKNGYVYGTEVVIDKVEKCEYCYVIKGDLYLDLGRPAYPIFDINRYHDVFRVYNYPQKIIHSRHELRKWMRKRYFDLEEWQLEKISKFFRENPGGIITFG